MADRVWNGTPWCFHFWTLRRIQGVIAIMPCPCLPCSIPDYPTRSQPFLSVLAPANPVLVCLSPPSPAHHILSSSPQHPALALPFPACPVHWVSIQSCPFQAYRVARRVLRPLPYLPLPAPVRPPMPVEVCLVTLPVSTGPLLIFSLIFTITFSPGTHIFYLNI